MTKLSIIIPLYSVENHVSRGMESIKMQCKLKGNPNTSPGDRLKGGLAIKAENKLEVILVDDGSTDRSLEVCLDHLGNLPGTEIKSIRQENTGPGGARNTGIHAAKGEYIMFMDSDDFLLPGAIENILETLKKEQPDVLFGRYQRWIPRIGLIEGSKHDFSPPPHDSKSLTEYILTVFPEPSWNSAWRYICKRDMILTQKIFFEPSMYCEDMKWVLELLDAIESESKKLIFLPTPFYAYNYKRPGSIMNSASPKRLIDLVAIISEALPRYQDRQAICQELIWQIFYYINEYCTFCKADRDMIYRSYQNILPLFRLSGSGLYGLAGKCRHRMLFYGLSAGLFWVKSLRAWWKYEAARILQPQRRQA